MSVVADPTTTDLPAPPALQTDVGRRLLRNPGVVFLFPGQAAQYAAMGASLYENEPVFAFTCQRGPSPDCEPLRVLVYGSEQPTPKCVPSVLEQLGQQRFWLRAKNPCFSQLKPICSNLPAPPTSL